MTKRMYKTCTAVLSVALAIVVGWSVTAGNAVVPIVAVAVAVGLVYLYRKATKEVTDDALLIACRQSSLKPRRAWVSQLCV